MEVFGKELSREEQIEKTNQYRANLTRAYNKMYKNAGVAKKFHGSGKDLEWIAENSKFTPQEEDVINHFLDKQPELDRDGAVMELIDRGWL